MDTDHAGVAITRTANRIICTTRIDFNGGIWPIDEHRAAQAIFHALNRDGRGFLETERHLEHVGKFWTLTITGSPLQPGWIGIGRKTPRLTLRGRLQAMGEHTDGADAAAEPQVDLTVGSLIGEPRRDPYHPGFRIVSVAYSDDAAIVTFVGPGGRPDGDSPVVFTGTSKRRECDPANPLVGVHLAAARALRDASDYYLSFAEQAAEADRQARKQGR